jgi:hypothetical protein
LATPKPLVSPNYRQNEGTRKVVISSFQIIGPKLELSADMFESVNKKTPVHPFCKVGFSVVNRLPEELRLNSDG